MSNTSPIPAPEQRLISASEVSTLLGVGRVHVYNLIKRNVLPPPVYLFDGARPKWWRHEIIAVLNARRSEPAEYEAHQKKGRKMARASVVSRKAMSQ